MAQVQLPTYLDDVNLSVADLEASQVWYCRSDDSYSAPSVAATERAKRSATEQAKIAERRYTEERNQLAAPWWGLASTSSTIASQVRSMQRSMNAFTDLWPQRTSLCACAQFAGEFGASFAASE